MHHPLCSPKYLVVFLTAQPKDKRHLDCSMTGKRVNNKEKQVCNHPKDPLQSLDQLKPRTPILILQQIEMREMFKNKLAKKKELCFYTYFCGELKRCRGIRFIMVLFMARILKPRNHHTNPLGFILLEYIKFDKVAIGMEM